MNYSPLRYPGGKSKLGPLISQMISNIGAENITYIEPFAGGAGAALFLLQNGYVDKIVINDYDKAIYSFWRALKEQPDCLIEMIKNTPVNIKEWKKQRAIYECSSKYSIELGFAALYLNRTNRSGILNAGPIGGYQQNGSYKLDARFNKNKLIATINEIVKKRSKIKVYNKEVRSFITKIIPKYEEQSSVFTYFDPPYYVKGQRLYKNFFDHNDHVAIADLIKNRLKSEWIITYDNVETLRLLYKEFPQKMYYLNYSAGRHGLGEELLILKNSRLLLHKDNHDKQTINTNIQLF